MLFYANATRNEEESTVKDENGILIEEKRRSPNRSEVGGRKKTKKLAESSGQNRIMAEQEAKLLENIAESDSLEKELKGSQIGFIEDEFKFDSEEKSVKRFEKFIEAAMDYVDKLKSEVDISDDLEEI